MAAPRYAVESFVSQHVRALVRDESRLSKLKASLMAGEAFVEHEFCAVVSVE
jgi:hypothetical protein